MKVNKTISISVAAAQAAEKLNEAKIEVSIICEQAIMKAYEQYVANQKNKNSK
jgi:hypothetical protein